MPSNFFYTGIIGFTSGVFLRSFFDWGAIEIGFVGLLAAGLLGAWYLERRPRTSVLFLTGLFIGAATLGMFRLAYSDAHVSELSALVGEKETFTGTVVREPDSGSTAQHLYVRDTKTGELFLAFADPYLAVSYGDQVRVTGRLSVPESFDTDTGRTFDYEGYLKARGVHEVMYRAQVNVIASGEGNLVLEKLYVLKYGFMEVIERSIAEPAVGLGEGLLLGVKQALGDDLEDVFRTVGIIHIVVLSGYNIMIVADSVMRVLALMFFPRTRLLVGLAVILLFALLVGLSATVVRASIMAGLVLIARAFGRQYAVLRALMITGALMLMVNPHLLVFDPGFQLSFLATLGLILLSPELEVRMPRIPSALGIRGYLATTLGTQLFVLPVLLYSMGTLSFVSVIANMLVLPAVPIAMFLTFVTGVVGFLVSLTGVVVGIGAQLVLMYIIKIAELLASVPFAAMTVPPFPWWGILLMYVPIVLLTIWLKGRRAETAFPLAQTVPEDESSDNAYADWVIEEEFDEPLGTQSVPRGSKADLPFR